MARYGKPRQAGAALAAAVAAMAVTLLGAAPAGAGVLPRASSGCPAQNEAPQDASAAQDGVLCLLNSVRRARGLAPLRENAKLRRAAQRYTRHMIRRNCFDHNCPGAPGFSRRVLGTGYRGRRGYAIGENIAWGSGSYATPRSVTIMWMKSPGHRSNILSRSFREVGVGIATGRFRGSGRAAVYTTDFGRRY